MPRDKKGNYPFDVGKRKSYHFHLAGSIRPVEDGDGCMRPPSGLRDCTAFLYREENGEFLPIGSGVYLIIPDGEHVFSYLVTCKHVVKPLLDTHEDIYVRLNRSDQPTGVEHNVYKGQWLFHPDEAVDLAVLSIQPEAAPFEVHLIDAKKLFTKQREMATHHNIGEGDEVFFAGLFRPYHGYERNLAAYRWGRVSLVTNEQIEGPYGFSDYMLLEMLVFPFNSGSPLFTSHAQVPQPKMNRPGIIMLDYSIVGIASGFFPEKDAPLMNAVGDLVNYTHLGISTAIPAQKVWEILNMPEVVKARKDKIRAGRNATKQEPAGGFYPLIHFDRTTEAAAVFLKQRANLLEHAPCRLVRHAQLALQMLRADAAAGLSHQVDGVEPRLERRSGVLKDRPGHRVFVVAAAVAGVRHAVLHTVVLGHNAAVLALDPRWVQELLKPLKAGFVRGELLVEIADGVLLHDCFSLPCGDRLS